MDDGVQIAALGEHVGNRLPDMTRLGGKTVLLVDIEMGLHGARSDAIGSMIDEHVIPPLENKSARGRDGGILSADASGSSPAH